MRGPPHGLLQLAERVVQSPQAVVHEAAELQPGVHRGAPVRLVTLAGRRNRTQRPDLLDETERAVPSPPDGRARVTEAIDLGLQLVLAGGVERLRLDLDPRLAHPDPGRSQDPDPEGIRVHGAGQPHHAHAPERSCAAPGEATAQGPLLVHHHRVEGRTPPLRRLGSHMIRPRPHAAKPTPP